MERYEDNFPSDLGLLCMAISHIIDLGLRSGTINKDEHNVIYSAVWGVAVDRKAKPEDTAEAA